MKLSIIVVTWNNEDYIEQALRSCININYTNYEIIVVHNASTDQTLKHIKRAIKGYEHLFTVIENESNVDLGEGRNIGIHHARGEYLMFLDGDDWYSENAVESILTLLVTQNADLLIFDFLRYYSNDVLIANPRRKLLSDRLIVTDNDRVELFKNFGVAWNKVYKKSFIHKNNLNFPTLYYEDILWNVQCIINAKSIYVTQAQLIYYRQREGSILRSSSMKHFDAIIQHNNIVSLIENNSDLIKVYGQALRNYSRNQMFSTIDKRGRIPRGEEGLFLKLINKTLKKYDEVILTNKSEIRLLLSRQKIREWASLTGNYTIYEIINFFIKIPKKIMKHLK